MAPPRANSSAIHALTRTVNGRHMSSVPPNYLAPDSNSDSDSDSALDSGEPLPLREKGKGRADSGPSLSYTSNNPPSPSPEQRQPASTRPERLLTSNFPQQSQSYIYPFGRHKGLSVDQVPAKYNQYFLSRRKTYEKNEPFMEALQEWQRKTCVAGLGSESQPGERAGEPGPSAGPKPNGNQGNQGSPSPQDVNAPHDQHQSTKDQRYPHGRLPSEHTEQSVQDPDPPSLEQEPHLRPWFSRFSKMYRRTLAGDHASKTAC
jgi:hypothetical protein